MLNTSKQWLFQELHSAADNGKSSAYYVIVSVFLLKPSCPQAKHFAKWFDDEGIVISREEESHLLLECVLFNFF